MFDKCEFQFEPRKSQREILDVIFRQKPDENKLYIVSPPGSGKTITGLLATMKINVPTLVLAPNTAIQNQWVDKTRFFMPDGQNLQIASVNPDENTPITVLTYQALAQAKDINEDEREKVMIEWRDELIEEGESENDADEWLANFAANNPERFQASLARRWKKVRDEKEIDHEAGIVSDSALALMRKFQERGVKLVIFDECHHLLGYWAQVALLLVKILEQPRVIGLTATPPSPKDLSPKEFEMHKDLLRDIDFSLPTPAVVKDGNLVPYQDLAYFIRPRREELDYVRNCDGSYREALDLVEDSSKGTKLSEWLINELNEIPESSFAKVMRQRSTFLGQATRYLRSTGSEVPSRFASFEGDSLSLDEKADLVGRFASKHLMLSHKKEDRKLFDKLNRALRPLGFQLTEKGLRRCQSTVNRILALSQSKMDAMVDILTEELKDPEMEIRALIVTDFEKSSATIAKELNTLLTDESGGAVAAMRALTSNDPTDILDPILVTGQSVIVDDDLLPKFEEHAKKWFSDRGMTVEMDARLDGGFYRIKGSGSAWNTRNYVAMITHLFEEGVTRCLVGTRGLLGEGWDSLCANTLIDLTTASTEMTVNQLRGRAIRLNPNHPEKVANIWDVVCLAPEFEKGLSDYHRFARKHRGYYGICDDGAIEYGLGHIHPALKEAGPEDVALNAHIFNAEMLQRCHQRGLIKKAWKVGEPYQNQENSAIELKLDKAFENLPVRFEGGKYEGFELDATSQLKNLCLAVLDGLRELGLLRNSQSELEVSERADEYFRIFLDCSTDKDMELFTKCVEELFQPLESQRYIIPRYEQVWEDNWLTKMLPDIVRQYVVRKKNQIAVYHPLPDPFAKSKKNAEVFTRKWNLYVSPGEAVFTQRGEGEKILAEAKTTKKSVKNARAKLKSVWR